MSIFKREKWIGVAALIAAAAMIGIIIWMASAIESEIEECGGVAKCLGEAVKDFDEARDSQ